MAPVLAPSGYVPPPEGQTDRERDDLQAMLASPGWAIFCAYVAAWWKSDPVLERLESLLEASDADVAQQHETCAQILASRRAVHTIMSWPLTRIHHLSGKPLQAARRPRRARC